MISLVLPSLASFTWHLNFHLEKIDSVNFYISNLFLRGPSLFHIFVSFSHFLNPLDKSTRKGKHKIVHNEAKKSSHFKQFVLNVCFKGVFHFFITLIVSKSHFLTFPSDFLTNWQFSFLMHIVSYYYNIKCKWRQSANK